jgi:predicted nuclease of predicted toxin-antitoxin system
MKILIDECLPRKLKQELPGHEVKTVPEMGWASKKNGELLRLMSDQFDVFLTIDSNLRYQQDLTAEHVACIVLRAYNNRLATLKPLMPKVMEILKTIQRGDIAVIQ